MPTKAPPPIVPSRGSGTRYRPPRPKKPNWGFWKHIPAPELWELVALSCDVDPRTCNKDQDFTEDDETYKDRLAIATANLGKFKQVIINMAYSWRCKIPAGQFVAFAQSVDAFRSMPAEFEALGEPPLPPKASTQITGTASAEATKKRAQGKTAKAKERWAAARQIADEYMAAHRSAKMDPEVADHVRVTLKARAFGNYKNSTILQKLKPTFRSKA